MYMNAKKVFLILCLLNLCCFNLFNLQMLNNGEVKSGSV